MSSNPRADFGDQTTEQNASSACGFSVGATMFATNSSSNLSRPPAPYTSPSNPRTFSTDRNESQYVLSGARIQRGVGSAPRHGANLPSADPSSGSLGLKPQNGVALSRKRPATRSGLVAAR